MDCRHTAPCYVTTKNDKKSLSLKNNSDIAVPCDKSANSSDGLTPKLHCVTRMLVMHSVVHGESPQYQMGMGKKKKKGSLHTPDTSST